MKSNVKTGIGYSLPTILAVLKTVKQDEGCTRYHIGKTAELDLMTTWHYLKRMESMGLVDKADGDKCKNRLKWYMTGKGEALLNLDIAI